MTHEHLAYLQQASDLLQAHYKPLAARLGFIAKEICLKHTIHINGLDAPKLRRCKACQAPITCDDINYIDKRLVVRCSLCATQRYYGHKHVKANQKLGKKDKSESRKRKIKEQKMKKKKKRRQTQHTPQKDG